MSSETINTPSQGYGSNLLDLDDTTSTPVPAGASPTSFSLRSTVDLTPQQYQALWQSLEECFNGRLCGLVNIPTTTQEVEAVLRQQHVS